MSHNSTAIGINGELRVGDTVVSTNLTDYSYLVGTIIDIVKLGTPEHGEETDNDTDSVHVDFSGDDYSAQRISEIEAMFTALYGVPKEFDDCALDDVIMPPESLIRINDLAKADMDALLQSEKSAAMICGKLIKS